MATRYPGCRGPHGGRVAAQPRTLYRTVQRMLEQGLISRRAAARARPGRRAAALLPDDAVRRAVARAELRAHRRPLLARKQGLHRGKRLRDAALSRAAAPLSVLLPARVRGRDVRRLHAAAQRHPGCPPDPRLVCAIARRPRERRHAVHLELPEQDLRYLGARSRGRPASPSPRPRHGARRSAPTTAGFSVPIMCSCARCRMPIPIARHGLAPHPGLPRSSCRRRTSAT